MPLHYKTKEAAVKKYGHLVGDELVRALKADANNYTTEESDEILATIAKEPAAPGPGATSQPKPEQKAPAAKSSSPNAKIADKLKDFDYNRLSGEAFKRYCLYVQSLQMDGSYDFEQYQVEVIKRQRYPGMKDSPVDTVGFKIKNSTPVNTTRIPVKFALTMNGTVVPFKDEAGNALDTGFETLGCQLDHNGAQGRYYLLKKVS